MACYGSNMWCAGNGWRLSLVGTALLLGCGGTTRGSPNDSPPDSPISCSYDGRSYQVGDGFPATDGCNSCSCEADGSVGCTERGCESCESIATRYGTLTELARRCDPAAPNQCTQPVFEGLLCGCDTFVAVGAWNQSEVDALQQAYSAMNCGAGVTCGACAPPPRAHCSPAGRCVDDDEPEPGPACKVNGVVYPDGASNIPDPVSCNTCVCQAGQLACDNASCPKPCPAGTLFAQSCAECGPTDACLVVELGCMPTCTDACDAGFCNQGICVSVCG